MRDGTKRSKFFITVTLLPVKLRIAMLNAQPGQGIEGVV
jgi:hypothetical protein